MKKLLYKITVLAGIAFICFMGIPKLVSATETIATEDTAERKTDGTMVESLSVSIGKKGFNPSKDNYLRIKSYIDTGYEVADVRLRIYNKKGKFVFEKTFENTTGGFLDCQWNGKASKNNEAGVARRYVKKGTYTVEVCAIPLDPNMPISMRKYVFKINKKAPAGQAGIAAAKTLPILTGDAEVDYMAEQICKAAGVKSSQSDAEKVRLIYHWMTLNQKHEHYYEGGNFKKHYKLSKAATKKKIAAYKKKTDKKCKNGKLIYNHDYDMIRREWCMERRIGVCTDHAAIFKILCNHVGIEADIHGGYYLNRNGTKAGHDWNSAIIDGVTYYYDVDVEIQNLGKGQGDYYWFQKTRQEAEKTHEFHY